MVVIGVIDTITTNSHLIWRAFIIASKVAHVPGDHQSYCVTPIRLQISESLSIFLLDLKKYVDSSDLKN